MVGSAISWPRRRVWAGVLVCFGWLPRLQSLLVWWCSPPSSPSIPRSPAEELSACTISSRCAAPSGLINTSRQIGGSVGLAAVTTIAATASSHYAHGHAVPAFSAPALTHGFQVAFYALIGVALAGAAILAAAFVESKPKAAPTVKPVEAELALEEAA